MADPQKKHPLCKILVVDDELGIDSFFYDFFSLRNYEVLTALSGKEALDLVKKERPRIVLLDITMRGMDGLEVLRKIKELDRKTVVIMVTGVHSEKIREEALASGADEYITKPLSLEYLDKVVFLKHLNTQIRDITQG